MDNVAKTARLIRELKIQGATDIAVRGLESLKGAKDADLDRNIAVLSKARPNEPLLLNGLRYVKAKHRVDGIGDAVDAYIRLVKESKAKAVKTCSEAIRGKAVIMTHCHSSLVVESIIAAADGGKKPAVFVTDTRPRYQGMITAKELAKAGIPVKFIIDSAARHYINDCDLFLMGSDAITANSHFLNKIGTSLMAMAAKESRTDVGAVVQLLKADTRTVAGEGEKIEMRSPKEVWDKAPNGVTVLNPAFDLTPPNFINFVACEAGIISAFTAFQVALQKYPWLVEGSKWY
jgi:ribose 1,5-bisphosphate isomerase